MQTHIARIAFLVCLALSCSLHAQNKKFKIGKITPKDFDVKYQHIDSVAEAVVVYSNASRSVVYTHNDVQAQFYKEQRIKINSKKGLSWGDFTLYTHYKHGGLDRVQAYTHNLENGKVVTTKLEKKSIFKTKVDENTLKHTFSVPNLKEGSIIDVSYSISSPNFYNLPNYYFQKSVPVLYSRFEVKYPEYFDYYQLSKGFFPIRLVESSAYAENIGSGGNQSTLMHQLKVFEGTDIPPFKAEPYISSKENYLSSISFDLHSINVPGNPTTDLSQTWQSLTDYFLRLDHFGKQLNRKDYLKELLATIDLEAAPEERIQQCYEVVKKAIKNNYDENFLVKTTLKDVLKSGLGSGTEINLILVALLRMAEIPADPVILSTRSHGHIWTIQPRTKDFNYAICAIKSSDQYQLVDASDRTLSIDALPIKCYNGNGWLLSEDRAQWIPIAPDNDRRKSVVFDMHISDNKIQTKVKETLMEYEAANERADISEHESHDQFLQEWIEDNSELNIANVQTKGLDSEAAKLINEFEVNTDKYIEQVDELTLINPLLYEATSENPFKLEEREYPVDFGVGINESITTKLTLTKGMEFESWPEDEVVTIGNDARFIFKVISQKEDALIISSRISVKKTIFQPNEYASLKTFFDKIVAKHEEPIVILTTKNASDE